MNKITKPLISIIIPAYNEVENLPDLLQRIDASIVSAEIKEYETIVVDDGSNDGTEHWASATTDIYPQLVYKKLARNQGHQIAISTGMTLAIGAATIVMDADLQNPPETLPTMIDHWRQGFKIVAMRRKTNQSGFILKEYLSRFFYRCLKLIAPTTILDSPDFYLLDKEVVDLHLGMGDFHKYHRGLIAWYPFPRIELDYVHAKRHRGKAKYNFIRSLLLALNALGVSLKLRKLQGCMHEHAKLD